MTHPYKVEHLNAQAVLYAAEVHRHGFEAQALAVLTVLIRSIVVCVPVEGARHLQIPSEPVQGLPAVVMAGEGFVCDQDVCVKTYQGTHRK